MRLPAYLLSLAFLFRGVKMPVKTAAATLKSFVRNECANYYDHYSICVMSDNSCRVLKGKRCGYFERAVLGPPDYKYRSAGYNYGRIFEQYSKLKKELRGELHKVKEINRCALCGESIPPNFKYCEKCGKRQKRDLHRERMRMKRNG